METVSKKEIEIALDWMRGAIGLSEAARRLKVKLPRNSLPRMAVYLREAYRKRMLVDNI